MVQVRIFGRVVTFILNTKSPDFGFFFRITKLEKNVIGFRSALTNNDIYTNQMHIGIFDADDLHPLGELVEKIKEVQEKFKEFVGNCYIYETSPNKYSFHFYNPATYWNWLKVAHFCRDFIDDKYLSWRLKRDSFVMRYTPKSNGFVPKFVCFVKSEHPRYEDIAYRNKILEFLKFENEKGIMKYGS